MNNQIYKELNQQSGINSNSDFLSRFNQFRSSFKGDPRTQIQSMLNSGRITQAQYNNAVRIAQQFQKMFGGRF